MGRMGSVALANREILYARRCLLVLRVFSDIGQFAGKGLVFRRED